MAGKVLWSPEAKDAAEPTIQNTVNTVPNIKDFPDHNASDAEKPALDRGVMCTVTLRV